MTRFHKTLTQDGNPYPNNPDVSAFLTQAQSNGLAAYANIQTDIRQLGGLNENDRIAAAANLLTQNNALTGIAVYQANEKTVNGIFLQRIAVGNFAFSEPQITSLENIAEGCPLSDGEAVLRARAMLNVLEREPKVYDDFVACYGGERSDNQLKESKQSSQLLRIFPNPAGDVITIEYDGLGNSDQRLVLFNIFGQVAMEITLPEGQGRIQAPVNTLPGGIYWYSMPGTSIFSGKLIISR